MVVIWKTLDCDMPVHSLWMNKMLIDFEENFRMVKCLLILNLNFIEDTVA